MVKLDRRTIGNIEERFIKKPFCADRVKIAEVDGHIDAVITHFEIPHQNREKVEKACSYLKRKGISGSFELSNGAPNERRTLGFIPMSAERLLIWRKVETVGEAEKEKDYGIDAFYLDIARRAVMDIVTQRGEQVIELTYEKVSGAIRMAIAPYKKAIRIMVVGFSILLVEVLIVTLFLVLRFFWR